MTRLRERFWLDLPATKAVMQALEGAGGRDCARFVGGCVRDAVLGRSSEDVDIATMLEPEAVVAAIEAAGLKAVPTGLAHGTITAVSDHRPYEITTLRRDVSTDGRNATVAFTQDWAEDARRRDFRLNALYADADGLVFDPTGEGVADAQAGRIVFVGDPVTRIREDYLRILRFFRFFAWYGRGAPDAEGLAACKAEREGMARLSAERVQKELLKLLAAPDPVAALRAMEEAGVLEQILPGAVAGQAFADMCRHSGDPVQRLMMLMPVAPEVVRVRAESLRLSNAVRDRLVDAARTHAEVHADMSVPDLHRTLYRHGRTAVGDALARAWGQQPGDRAALAARLVQAAAWSIPQMPVSGRDVTRLGVPAGPEVGAILSRFEAEWMALDFPTDGHLERLQALVQSERGQG